MILPLYNIPEPQPDYFQHLTTQQEILMCVNDYRRQEGLEQLRLSSDLSKAAVIRVKEIAQSFSHTRPDGSTAKSLLNPEPKYLGENLLEANVVNPKLYVKAWMDSKFHRDNLFSSMFRNAGIAIRKIKGNYYVVMILTD